MPDFILIYHAATQQPASPEEGKAHFEKWQNWLSDLGEAVVNLGTPLGQSIFVTANGASEMGTTPAITGYSVVSAADLDAAVKIATDCPYTDMGPIEVAEMKQM